MQSSNLDNGYVTIPKANIKNLTIGATAYAIASYEGPVHIAYGMTSPTNNTAVTDIIIAHIEGTSLSKNIGSASIANALASNNVTSR
jgi:hypothetical protein